MRKLNSKNLPGFREASEFDFFRGEAGRQDRPDLFDDGSLPEQPMRKLKGFCDVGNTVLTKERWGAAKFPQGQMRIYMVNDLDLSAEPKYETGMGTVSHKEFMQMLEPAWMKGSTLSDVNAVLKRTRLLVITKGFLYCRLATEAVVPVQRMPLDAHMSLLRKSGGEKYMQYRKGDRHLPDDFPLHVRWEEAWMRSIMENKGRDLPPMPVQVTGRSLFASPTSEPKTTMHVQVPAAKAFIKKEPGVFNRLLSNANHVTIELDGPQRKKPRVEQTPIKQEPASASASASRPSDFGVIDLVSDEEGGALETTNPRLNIENMEEEEDVFNHGGGLETSE